MEDIEYYQGDMGAHWRKSGAAARPQKNSQTGYLRQLAECLMGSGPMQRPALARRIGLPRQTVSDLLASLESRGLVQVSGALDGLPGRSQLSYALRANAALALGFDVGGTKLAGGLCDMRGTVLAEMTEPTDRGGAEGLVAQIAAMAENLCRKAGLPRFHVRNSAIGVPAAIDPQSGMPSLADNLPGLDGAPLRDALATALGGEVHLDNDVNLALLAETARGAARGRNNVVFIALGTGIGGALLVNDHLLRGAFGGAGEIGYMPCPGAEGTTTLEAQVGEAGIRRAYGAAGGDPGHTVRDIFAAAEAGNAAASAALDGAAAHVAQALIAILALVDAEMVVFGGSIGARPEFIARVERRVAAGWIRPVVLQRSAAGGRAGLLGALETARQFMLEDLFGPAPSNQG